MADGPQFRATRFEDRGIADGGGDYLGWDYELRIGGRQYALRRYEDTPEEIAFTGRDSDRIRGGVPYDDPTFTEAVRWLRSKLDVKRVVVLTSDPEFPDDSYAPVDFERLG